MFNKVYLMEKNCFNFIEDESSKLLSKRITTNNREFKPTKKY